MMVTFVSQCEKNALKKTRRVLDAFADRIGDNTWQTLITQEGLLAVKKLLRKTASKSTAVSCHWIRSRSRSELLWVVGKRDRFDATGRVPVNTTQKSWANSKEDSWQYLPLIQALTAVAALFHDWGKASDLFQQKLKPSKGNKFKGDPIRHEWISCLLLSAFIKESHVVTDADWLERLSKGELDETKLKKYMLEVGSKEYKPLKDLPPLARLVAWLIVSHHRLPNLKKNQSGGGIAKCDAEYYLEQKREDIEELLALVSKGWGYENRYDEDEYQQRIEQCFTFSFGLLTSSKKWLSGVKKWAGKLKVQQDTAERAMNDGSCRVILTHSRLCLMLGDHFYSSQDAAKNWHNTTGLFANTDRDSQQLKQKLDEHLFGVCKAALQNAYYLPRFEQELPQAHDINSLKKPSPKAFSWQDKAVKEINKWRDKNKYDQFGFFTVNMASTGCGKTFANAKIMRALSETGDSLRYTLALGLRTLTLQTGDEYRERIGLDDSELAVMIGSNAVLELHKKNNAITEEKLSESTGSESVETLLDDEIDFDCNIPVEGLATVLTNERDRKFLYAPVLTCTIDHMMSATECVRGGRYILPSLRMMSADLVIDEIDDFSGDDLVAIGRLIFFAGMMGRKVMISSATIPPDLAEGYFKAYRDGWGLFAKSQNIPAVIGGAWVDEFKTQVCDHNQTELSDAIKGYRNAHNTFIEKRVAKLAQQPAKRKASVLKTEQIVEQNQQLPVNDAEKNKTKEANYFEAIAKEAAILHGKHNTEDGKTGLNVSFGVVRVANISPCVNLTRYLLEDYSCDSDTEIRVMCYHSQQVLLMRAEQEKHLDDVLKRKEKEEQEPLAFSNIHIRYHLDIIAKKPDLKNVIFILIATPVEEVGRDHDFDWAIIEPSSYRSIIQLAGRVRRHRDGDVDGTNISILQHNVKTLKQNGKCEKPAFEKPGFETSNLLLKSHDLAELIDEDLILTKLDAVPRIQKLTHHNARYFSALTSPSEMKAQSLAELEHASIWSGIANYATKGDNRQFGPNTFQGYLRESWWLTGLPQVFFRFRDGNSGINTYLTYLHEQEAFKFCEKDEQGFAIDRQAILEIQQIELSDKAMERLWLYRDYTKSIKEIASQKERSLRWASLRYGELNFLYQEGKKYEYNDQFGLVKQ